MKSVAALVRDLCGQNLCVLFMVQKIRHLWQLKTDQGCLIRSLRRVYTRDVGPNTSLIDAISLEDFPSFQHCYRQQQVFTVCSPVETSLKIFLIISRLKIATMWWSAMQTSSDTSSVGLFRYSFLFSYDWVLETKCYSQLIY
jgi:hypothetical protein